MVKVVCGSGVTVDERKVTEEGRREKGKRSTLRRLCLGIQSVCLRGAVLPSLPVCPLPRVFSRR